ncbi:MAG TPA: hypothetical protein DG577_03070 [Firmicutes bacterium]|nr:hypothetical protein [Bacillota bacterium]
MRVLIANLGNSDVYVKGRKLTSQREEAKQLLQDFIDVADDAKLVAEVAHDIDLPLLEAALEKCGEPVDLLVAFVTDQPSSVGEKIWPRDTIEVGRLVKYLYEKNIGKFAQKVKRVKIKIIQRPPNIYDDMMHVYPDMLKELELIEGIKDADAKNEVFISFTGGTPACNIALLYSSINAMSVPGYKRYLYTSESNGKAEFMHTQTMIGRIEILKFIEGLITRWDYDGVIQLLDNSFSHDKHLLNLLKALESRLNFRFEDIDTDIRGSLPNYEGNIFKELMEERDVLINAIDTVDTSAPVHPEQLFNELYWSMRVRYEIGNYVDFISRFFRLVEGLLRLEACRINSCSVAELKNLVDIQTDQPGRLCLHHHILRNKKKANPDLVNWAIKANEIINLRHDTIHDMKGLSKRSISKEWGGDILADTEEMLEKYFDMKLINPFEKYNEWVISYCHQVL